MHMPSLEPELLGHTWQLETFIDVSAARSRVRKCSAWERSAVQVTANLNSQLSSDQAQRSA